MKSIFKRTFQLVFLCLSFSCFLISAQINQTKKKGDYLKEKQIVFKDGEWLEFRIHYGFFNASYVTLSLEKEKFNEYDVFHSKGYGKTTGLLRFFFKVEDIYESYFDINKTLPLRFIRKIDEGGYTKNTIMILI